MKKLLLFLALALGCAAQTILPTTALFGGQVTPAAPSGGAGVFSSVTDTGLTNGRLVLVGPGGLLQDSANFTYVDGTTTGQLIHPVGAVGTPSVTFLGDLNTGLYWIGADNFGLSVGGTKTADFSATTGIALTAVGTNQNITLTPSGTGGVSLSGSGSATLGLLRLPASTTMAQGIAWGTDTFLFRSGGDTLALSTPDINAAFTIARSNTAVGGTFTLNTDTLSIQANRGAMILATNGTTAALTLDASQNAQLVGKITSYNAITTAGQGVPVIVAAGRATAQSAANASISTYTVGAADGSFEISGNMNVTAATSLVTTLTCTYTDESNTARTMIFPVTQLNGSFIALGAITGTGAWETPTMHIRCKAATAITILTSAGTFTGVTYTAEGIIRKLN